MQDHKCEYLAFISNWFYKCISDDPLGLVADELPRDGDEF
jgi:hypothetical protein